MKGLEIFLIFGVIFIMMAIILGIASIIFFCVKGKKLRDNLKEEYGEPSKYNLKIME